MRAGLAAAVAWIAGGGRRAFLVIFGLAFVLRLGLLAFRLIPEPFLVPATRQEPEAIAASLVRTGAFADPYAVPTGPTAHVPPLHPAALAAILTVFGPTPTAGVVKWLLVFAAYATLFALLPWLGGRLGVGRPAGVIGGLAGALAVTWPEEVEPFAGLVLLLLVAAFHRRWTAGAGSPGASLALGVAAGAAFHLQPVLLAVVSGCVAFELWWRRDVRTWRLAAALALGAALACAPWAWRNYRTFGEVFFVRSNLGLELRMGNHEGATAEMERNTRAGTAHHPRTDTAEAERVRAMGERAYMHEAGRAALAWIRENPGTFLGLTVRRFARFWLGPSGDPMAAAAATVLAALAALGAALRFGAVGPPSRAALLVPLATYPLIYYVLAYLPRYRVPVDGLLLLLAGAAVWRGLAGPRATAATGG